MDKRSYSLEPLNFPDLEAEELLDIAALTGFKYVSLTPHSSVPILRSSKVVADPGALNSLVDKLARSGIKVLNLECFNLTGSTQIEDCRPALAVRASTFRSSRYGHFHAEP
jgi:sugar phosphate isomerase/epimerase